MTVQGLANVEVGNAHDFKDLITAGTIATDKVALFEGRLPGQKPLALQLLVNGNLGIDNRTISISDKEWKELDQRGWLRMSRVCQVVETPHIMG